MAAAQILVAALAEQGVTVDQTVPALPEAQPAALPAELKACAGYYGTTAAQYRVDLTDDGKLTLHSLNYPTTVPDQVFTYHSDGTFRDATGAAAVSFVREDNGETYLYQKGAADLPGLGALPVSNYFAVKLAENPIASQAPGRLG